ncbi:MAG: ABC transporter [Clostridiales bacterium]|nr:MAG: ABC transporter [Clostridiales bacterium]
MHAIHFRIKMLFKYKDLISQLVIRDLKLKYRRSFLGYVWSILNPLLIMIVMTVVFSTMFSRNIENFPVYLLAGRTIFEFVTGSTTQAMHSVTANSALLKKAYVPKYIFTLSKITSALIDMVFSLGALIIVMVATHAKVTIYIVFFPIVLVQVYLFSLGLGFFLAQANVFFRDIQYIYKAVVTAWMYLTPIFYPIESLPEKIQYIITRFNPLYYYVAQFRDVIYVGQLPEVRLFWGGWVMAILMLLFGLWTFQKNKDKFILYI